MLQDWTIYSWYCPNCKTEVCGIKDKKDQIKAKCERCGVYMVRNPNAGGANVGETRTIKY